MRTTVAGVLLAAGEGSRFGQPKALVELNGQTLAERGVGLLRAGGADPILVVTGAVPLELDGTLTVDNPQWRTGMGSSLRAALQALTEAGRGPDIGPGRLARKSVLPSARSWWRWPTSRWSEPRRSPA